VQRHFDKFGAMTAARTWHRMIAQKYRIALITTTFSTRIMFLFYSHDLFQDKNTSKLAVSVADPGCLSRIPNPDFYSIPDPTQKIHPSTV
jgi:hypothetical protein